MTPHSGYLNLRLISTSRRKYFIPSLVGEQHPELGLLTQPGLLTLGLQVPAFLNQVTVDICCGGGSPHCGVFIASWPCPLNASCDHQNGLNLPGDPWGQMAPGREQFNSLPCKPGVCFLAAIPACLSLRRQAHMPTVSGDVLALQGVMPEGHGGCVRDGNKTVQGHSRRLL